MAGQTKVVGGQALRRKLEAMPKAAKLEIRKALEKSAVELSNMARQLAPEDSGDLKRSIGYTFGADVKPGRARFGVNARYGSIGDQDLSVAVHAGDEKAFYAKWVELGTASRREKGVRPYMGPAFRLLRNRIKGRIKRAVKKAARGVANGSLK